MRNLYARASVFVEPARYEPFGLAALEAAPCGCALVLGDIPSLREVWGDSALYFRDAVELEAALRELSSNAELLAKLQLASCTRAQRFTAARMTSEYLALYEALLHGGVAPRAGLQDLVAHAL